MIALLKDDAVLTMPPLPGWFKGRDAIARFYNSKVFHSQARGPFRLLPLRANGCPAFALYQTGPGGTFIRSTLHVLALSENRIARIDKFLNLREKQFRRFGLLLVLSD